jgi:hypothetical protein
MTQSSLKSTQEAAMRCVLLGNLLVFAAFLLVALWVIAFPTYLPASSLECGEASWGPYLLAFLAGGMFNSGYFKAATIF